MDRNDGSNPQPPASVDGSIFTRGAVHPASYPAPIAPPAAQPQSWPVNNGPRAQPPANGLQPLPPLPAGGSNAVALPASALNIIQPLPPLTQPQPPGNVIQPLPPFAR